MLIYICNNCKQVLKKVYQVSTRTIKKELPPLIKETSTMSTLGKGYTAELIEEELLYYICPVCNKNDISEIDLTKENFVKVVELVQENKIKDALELIFEALL